MRINNNFPGISSQRSLTADAKEQDKAQKDLQSGETIGKDGDKASRLSLSEKIKTQATQEETGINKTPTNLLIQNEKMAQETMQATQDDILGQPDMALQSQANQTPQEALQLLSV